MAGLFWQNLIKHIQDGERVEAGVAGRPDRSLEGNLRYLKAVVEAALLGEALIIRDVSLETEALVGHPVWWNPTTQVFERGLAAVEEDATSGTLVPSPSSDVVGVVCTKTNTTLGDVLIAGRGTLDLINAVDEVPIADGRYYLSSAQEGKLTTQRPPVSVFVLTKCGDEVFVMPQVRDFLEDHIHYRFELFAEPAGDTASPGPGGRHEITNADPTKEGWLPADDPSFAGKAPTGAVFGYNLATHTAVQRVFPPIPLSASVFFWDKGEDLVGATETPSELVRVTKDGIWWFSDCYGDVPWPKDLDTTVSSSSLSSVSSAGSLSSAAGPTCPRPERMRVIFSFAKMTFATDKSVVTSAQPAPGSPIRILNCDGVPGTTGDLFWDLDLAFLVEDANLPGHTVFKEFDTEEGVFRTGPVVEALKAGTNIELSSSAPQTVDGAVCHQGLVTINANVDPTERALNAIIFRLGDAKERLLEDKIPYIGFVDGRTSALQQKYDIPFEGLPAPAKAKLRIRVLGTIAGSLPDMTATFLLLPRPTPGPSSIPTSETPLPITITGAIGANEEIEFESDLFDLAAGDIVLITLERDGAGDAYAGEVGILRSNLIITAGP